MKNPKKELISGISPIEVYWNPETYGLARMSTLVNQQSAVLLGGGLTVGSGRF
jgi:hypothetical protein